ncbi:MAG: phage tail protein [Pseudomonadales bacterium]|nr:phage tail protein [Pseudomonadales bacterium]NRA15187.1 hypothetical protein [Oceanospirillaceae bacterium]
MVDIEPGQSLDQILSKFTSKHIPGPTQPVIARIQGKQIDPANWGELKVAEGDVVVLSPRPFFDPITIAIAAISAGTAAYSYVQMRKMKGQQQQKDFRDLPEQSPTYDASAQGNNARLGQPIPVSYGLHRANPDFAAQPYRRYENGKQYLFNLFSIGQGKHQLSGRKIGDTPFDRFESITEQLCAPGEKVELFASEVITSDEVANLDLHATSDPDFVGWSGPFTVCPNGVQCTRIEIDLILNGLYLHNDNGDLVNATVTASAEYREIDDSGVAIGGWLPLLTHSITDKTNDAIRHTVGQNVPAGRYEIRVQRTNTTSVGNSRLRDDLIWSELKAFIESDATYDHTVWAVKILVTGQLSGQSERKFSCMDQRLVDVWDGSAWVADQPSRNIAWAFCDMVKGKWGGGYADEYLDLEPIKRLADIWDARGDYFDYRFDTKGTLDSALQLICRAGRAVKIEHAGVYSIVRDEPKAVADYQFGMTEIINGSPQIPYTTQDQWADDSVEVTYIDNETNLPQTIICALPGNTSLNPKKVKLEGVTTRQHAYREGMFLAAVTEFRNRSVVFKTELAGGLPDYGSSIAISHALSNWGTSGTVEAAEIVGGETLLTLSEPVVFEEGQTHVIQLADILNQPQGIFAVTEGDSPHQVVISTSENAVIYTGFVRKRTSFQFGVADKQNRRFIMRNISPVGGLQFELSGEYDDPRVHNYDDLIDNGTMPVPALPSVFSQDLEQVRGLRISFTGGYSSPVLNVTWSPVTNAERFILETSRNAGSSWQSLVTTSDLWYQAPFDKTVNRFRIRPMSAVIGPWLEQEVSYSTEDQDALRPNSPTNLALSEPFVGRHCKIKWDAAPGISNWRVSIHDDTGAIKRTEGTTNPEYSYSYKEAEGDGVGRTFTVKVWALDSLGASSTQSADLAATNPQIGALGAVQVEAIIDQAIITVTTPNETDYAGVRVWQGSDANFVASVFNQSIALSSELLIAVPLPTDGSTVYLRVAGVDVWGDDDLTVSAAYSLTRRLIGKTEIAENSIETPHLAANSVTAANMFVESLSAINAYLGYITGGSININNKFIVDETGVVQLVSANGKMVLDAQNNQFVMYDGDGNEKILIGDDGSGNQVVRVSGNGRTSALTPDLMTIIASGSVNVQGRNADGSIGKAISLGGTYDFDDLQVIITSNNGSPAFSRYPHWNSISGNRVDSLYSYLTSSYTYYQIGSTTTNGRKDFDTYNGAKGGGGASYVAEPLNKRLVWDKGNQSSANEVFLSAYWEYSVYTGNWKNVIDIRNNMTIDYVILAKNYAG